MKTFLLLTALVSFSNLLLAQQKQHKIVFDYANGDTASFVTMVRQAANIMNVTGNAQLEIVCHGPGLDLLIKGRTTVQTAIQELQSKFNVVFAACESTLRRRGIDKSQLVPAAITVPLASLEISSRQQEGWSYIKAGHNP